MQKKPTTPRWEETVTRSIYITWRNMEWCHAICRHYEFVDVKPLFSSAAYITIMHHPIWGEINSSFMLYFQLLSIIMVYGARFGWLIYLQQNFPSYMGDRSPLKVLQSQQNKLKHCIINSIQIIIRNDWPCHLDYRLQCTHAVEYSSWLHCNLVSLKCRLLSGSVEIIR